MVKLAGDRIPHRTTSALLEAKRVCEQALEEEIIESTRTRMLRGVIDRIQQILDQQGDRASRLFGHGSLTNLIDDILDQSSGTTE